MNRVRASFREIEEATLLSLCKSQDHIGTERLKTIFNGFDHPASADSNFFCTRSVSDPSPNLRITRIQACTCSYFLSFGLKFEDFNFF